jgi:hypothetical protein
MLAASHLSLYAIHMSFHSGVAFFSGRVFGLNTRIRSSNTSAGDCPLWLGDCTRMSRPASAWTSLSSVEGVQRMLAVPQWRGFLLRQGVRLEHSDSILKYFGRLLSSWFRLNPKSLAAFVALGGLPSLVRGLHTDVSAGLSVEWRGFLLRQGVRLEHSDSILKYFGRLLSSWFRCEESHATVEAHVDCIQ